MNRDLAGEAEPLGGHHVQTDDEAEAPGRHRHLLVRKAIAIDTDAEARVGRTRPVGREEAVRNAEKCPTWT